MIVEGKIGYIRPRVAQRSSVGCSWAQPLWADYNYAAKLPTPKRGAQGNGVRFERKVSERLGALYPSQYVSSLAFDFKRFGEMKQVVIVDGLLLHNEHVVVVESKLRHTLDAWHQLRNLYYPVVLASFARPVRLLEVCRYYDPSVCFPEPTQLVVNIEQFLESGASMGCWFWGG